MPRFPAEVVSEILSWCDNDTLRLATRVTQDAERHLYRLIHMNSSARCDALVSAIHLAPRRANLVRGLRLMGLDDANRTTQLLMLLRRLERLNVTLWGNGFGVPPGGFPFRLRRLRLFGECDMLTPPYFLAFLEEQVEIEVLELVMSTDTARWGAVCLRASDPGAPLLLPKLKVLQARIDVIRAFLAHPRPLLKDVKVQTRNDELVPDLDSQEPPVEVAPALCAALTASDRAQLRSLTIGTCNVVDTMRLLPGVIHGLESLELMIANGEPFEKFSEEFQRADPSTYTAPVLPSLKRFMLHVVNIQSEGECDALAARFRRPIVLGLHRIMPALEDCKLSLRGGTENNPTIIYAQLPRESKSRGPLDEAFADLEFFCGV